MNCKNPNKIIHSFGNKKKWVSGFDQSDLKNPNLYTIVPCKRCKHCKKSYGFNWGIRNYLEAKSSKDNYFVTLTYNDEHLPINDHGFPVINYQDVQKFYKKLRKDNQTFRYFGSSEYGAKTYRPHYHINFFGLKIDDLKFYKNSGEYKLYTSDYLAKKWGRGHVIIGDLDLATTFYICNYQLKKASRNKEEMEELEIPQESSFMSKRPSIGLTYCYQNLDKLLADQPIPIAFKNETIITPYPAIFKRHFIDKYTRAKKNIEDLEIKKITLELYTKKDQENLKKYQKIEKELKPIYHHLKEQKELSVEQSMYELKTTKKDFRKIAKITNRLLEKKSKIFKEIL